MSKSDINLLLTGDIMLGGEFIEFKKERNLGWEYSFEGVKPLFKEADIIFGNLECTLSRSGEPRADKNMALYSPPDSLQALKYLGYNIISIGNNHINDYGEQGLAETIEILQQQGFPYFGAGGNLIEASKPGYIEKEGVKLVFLGYTTDESDVRSIIANAKRVGCVPYDLSTIKRDIAQAKSEADVVCISLHWGYQYQVYPSPKQIKLAHRIIEAGADIIIGTHPHIVQGFERYRQGVIFYSLGNFFFPNYYYNSGFLFKWPRESNQFIIARCKVSKAGVGEVEIIPGFRNENQKVIILADKGRGKAIANINNLSTVIKSRDFESNWNKSGRRIAKVSRGAFFQRARELGFRGCIRKISMHNIQSLIRILIGHLIPAFMGEKSGYGYDIRNDQSEESIRKAFFWEQD